MRIAPISLCIVFLVLFCSGCATKEALIFDDPGGTGIYLREVKHGAYLTSGGFSGRVIPWQVKFPRLPPRTLHFKVDARTPIECEGVSLRLQKGTLDFSNDRKFVDIRLMVASPEGSKPWEHNGRYRRDH